MAALANTPMNELQAVLCRYDHEIDEPDAIRFMAKVREKGLIDDGEWKNVLQGLDNAMVFLKEGVPKDKSGALIIDADPRNADWTRIVRAQRLAGYRMPHWASLWLWRMGYNREKGSWWKQIGTIAQEMELPRFE
ncbi:MAG: hypothetical protein GX811_01225 [Lentisphaerae bacterium]|nr:hypothetical protein [Lentisphaerota bacterium]